MSSTKQWETLPSSGFEDRTAWQSLGNNEYTALRMRLLIVRSIDRESRFGPAIEEHNIPPGATFTLRLKRQRVFSRTDSIAEAVRFASTTRLSNKLSTKIGAELGAKIPTILSGKLQSQLLSQDEYEITEEIERTLTSTVSYAIEESEEIERTIGVESSTKQRTAQSRFRYWQHRWDVYLHSCEYLKLSYKREFFREVRETIAYKYGELGLPLGSVLFYQPQGSLDFTIDEVVDELDEPEVIRTETLTTAMPKSLAPSVESLQTLAEVAFPVTSAEKTSAKKRVKKTPSQSLSLGKGARKGPRKAMARKGPPRAKSAAKKKSAARAAPKHKSARKQAKRKTARSAPRGLR